MDTVSNEKKAKVVKSGGHSAIRVRKETRKRVLADLARVNKKDYGNNVRADEYIALAVSLVTPEHIRQLQEGSLSNADRLDRDYRAFVSKHGAMSKDEYLGKRLRGEIDAENASKSEPVEIAKSA